jgi:hypothetical protein
MICRNEDAGHSLPEPALQGKPEKNRIRMLPMKSMIFARIAALSLSTAFVGHAVAQDMPPSAAQVPPGPEAAPAPGNVPAPPPAGEMAPATPEAPTPPTPSAPPAPPADPNAAVPTGAVPADPGMVPAPAGVPQDAAAPMGSSANPVTVGGNVTPPPATPQDYPVCSKTVQDSCINPGEAKRKSRR